MFSDQISAFAGPVSRSQNAGVCPDSSRRGSTLHLGSASYSTADPFRLPSSSLEKGRFADCSASLPELPWNSSRTRQERSGFKCFHPQTGNGGCCLEPGISTALQNIPCAQDAHRLPRGKPDRTARQAEARFTPATRSQPTAAQSGPSRVPTCPPTLLCRLPTPCLARRHRTGRALTSLLKTRGGECGLLHQLETNRSPNRSFRLPRGVLTVAL